MTSLLTSQWFYDVTLIDQIVPEVMTSKVAWNVKMWKNACFCNYLINIIWNSFSLHSAFMKLVYNYMQWKLSHILYVCIWQMMSYLSFVDFSDQVKTLTEAVTKKTGRYGSTEWMRLPYIDMQQITCPLDPMHTLKVSPFKFSCHGSHIEWAHNCILSYGEKICNLGLSFPFNKFHFFCLVI